METWKTGKPFEESVRSRKEITDKLDAGRLASVFTLEGFLKETNTIFDRVVG